MQLYIRASQSSGRENWGSHACGESYSFCYSMLLRYSICLQGFVVKQARKGECPDRHWSTIIQFIGKENFGRLPPILRNSTFFPCDGLYPWFLSREENAFFQRTPSTKQQGVKATNWRRYNSPFPFHFIRSTVVFFRRNAEGMPDETKG